MEPETGLVQMRESRALGWEYKTWIWELSATANPPGDMEI